ncbi:MAG: glycosyltransferase family 39 protein [Phycisphaerales bacterium]|nr:glycosyltransferase family 39 protein [Phycisphaerales bacterium]
MRPQPRAAWVLGVAALIALGLAAWQSRIALILWALDGTLALIMLLMATLGGMAVLALLRLGPLSAAWRWLLAAGLGIGLLATLTLIAGVLGVVGAAHRGLMPVVLGIIAIVGVVCLLQTPEKPASAENAGRARWLWLLAAPFAAIVLIVATIPPGLLWQEEGMGYDVLEYHLELPKEYYDASTIDYLPYNVYANFPSNAEMLYLASCVAAGEPVESWSVSKCVNAWLAVLFVAATWLACREVSPQAGVVGGVLAATTGWVTYLSGIAYVENGMLLMGMLACGCVLRALRADDARLRRRWCIAAGLFAGLSCGFKYTAAPLIALPLLALLLIGVRARVRERIVGGLAYGVAVLVTFSPWLIKNTAMTANPVFPLLGNVFTDYPPGWGAEEAAHFAAVHAPAPQEATLAARLAALGRHVVLDPAQRFGVLVLVLAGTGLVRRRSWITLGLAVALAVQLGVWLFATHLYARFAVPLLIPLYVLAARGAVDAAGRLRASIATLIIVGVGFNLYHTARLYHDHVYAGSVRLDTEGGTSIFTAGILRNVQQLATINGKLPADAHILLVGEAEPFYYLRKVDYCVVFNRNPFVTVVEQSPDLAGILDWMREQGYTHVFVDWAEIARLRRSRYGFPNAISASLFEQLEDAGLQRMADYTFGDPARELPYGTLYAVPQTGGPGPTPSASGSSG